MVYEGVVLHGNKKGREIGFPTINLDPHILPADTKQGIYHAKIIIQGETYTGALYYGPRLVLNEHVVVLEINILDFDREIYGEKVSFALLEYIREPRNYDNFDDLMSAIAEDIKTIRTGKKNQ